MSRPAGSPKWAPSTNAPASPAWRTLFEHMMFKGTHTIGTSNIEQDLATIERLDSLRTQIQAEENKLIEGASPRTD